MKRTNTETGITTEVVVLRAAEDGMIEEWRVFVNGEITTPTFNSKGAAEAYADGIRSGYRKPEFRKAVNRG